MERISLGFLQTTPCRRVSLCCCKSSCFEGKMSVLGKLLTKQKCDCSEVVSVHEATFFLAELVKVNNIIIDFGHALASGSAVSVFAICSHRTGTALRTQGNCFKSQFSLRTRCQNYDVHDAFCRPQKGFCLSSEIMCNLGYHLGKLFFLICFS